MESMKICLVGVTITLILLSSVILGGYSLPFAVSPDSAQYNDVQTVLELLDFAQEEKYLYEQNSDENHHQREKRFPRIPMGKTCESNRDCSRSHCCAMKFAKPVCRLRPTFAQQCRLNAQSPLDASQLFTTCPCAHGLRCRRVKGTRKAVCA